MSKKIVFTTLVLLLSATGVVAQMPSPNPPASSEESTLPPSTSQQGASKNGAGSLTSPLPLMPAAPSIGEKEGHSQEQQSAAEWWLVVLTGVLAVATVSLWWATRCLVLGAEKTAERQLRAYVFMEPGRVSMDPLGPPWTVIFSFSLRNAGQTPAYDLQYNAVLMIAPHPLPANFPFPTMQATNGAKIVIHPGIRFDGHVLSQPLSQTDISRISGNKPERLYVFGLIEYKDTFGNARETRFCGSIADGGNLLALANGTPAAPTTMVSFEHAGQHNLAT